MLKSTLCDYSDASIFVEAIVADNNTAGAGVAANNTNKKQHLKNVLHLLISKANK